MPRDTPFVGRREELRRLDTAFEAATRGRGRIVLLVGEPGIGKTATAEQLAESAQKAGAEVLVGRCYEGAGAPPFWPWHQVLDAYVATRDASTVADDFGNAAADVAAVWA